MQHSNIRDLQEQRTKLRQQRLAVYPHFGVISIDHHLVKELIDHVAERLARYKRVRRVVFLDRLPRLPSGKVLRRELADTERTRDGRETDD